MKEVWFYSYIRLPARLFFFHPRPSLCLSAELEEVSDVLFISSQRILFDAVFLVLTQNQLERFEPKLVLIILGFFKYQVFKNVLGQYFGSRRCFSKKNNTTLDRQSLMNSRMC